MTRPLDVVTVWGVRLAVVLLAPLLLAFARTWRGRLIGLAALQAVLLPVSASVVVYAIATATRLPTALHVVVSLTYLSSVYGLMLCGPLAVVFTLLTLPAYRSDTSGVRSVFLGPTFLHRWQMAIFDEQDWLWLGGQLGTRLDPRIGRQEARDIRERVRELLDELKETPDYRDIPPALPLVFWGHVFRPDHGHLFVYRPQHEPGERLGLLVFLHRHGGNALLLPHLLRDFADAHRFVLVGPSFGYGNWEHPDSPAAVQRAVSYALKHFAEIDPARVYLSGLSQGGAGVGRAAVAMPDTFAGLVFVSGTMEPAVLNAEAFAGKRVLVIQGDNDRHVSLRSVLNGVEALKQTGADVTVLRNPTGTHSLLLTRTADVLGQLGDWLEGR